MNLIRNVEASRREVGHWRIDKAPMLSREYAEAERECLWPRVWQVACREEELRRVGSFVTYDILDDSIIVVRTGTDEIKAFNNACLHRGRRLTDEPCGFKTKFVCGFHGWRWNLDGTCNFILDEEDWEGQLTQQTANLLEYRVGTWGGFVFVNMDPACEPLETFIAPVAEICDPMEWHKHRYRWHISVELDANWKVAQGAFQEGYHTLTTHSQLAAYVDHRSIGLAHGPHGQQRYMSTSGDDIGSRNDDGRAPDARKIIIEKLRQAVHDIESISTERDLQAAARILTELPEDVSYAEASMKAGEFIREAALAAGVGFPEMSAEQYWAVGYNWSVFPNLGTVPSPTGGFWYRSLPSRDNDPDRCIFEMFSLERMTPGSEPRVKRQHFKDWREPGIPSFLLDDFRNIPEVQRGLKTRGFQAMRYNPTQEVPILNFHRALNEFMGLVAE